ncbi:MAG TPA: sialidase family protein, partial [Thermoanaerobaculia bacterium]|nr:sialidase family protein [Thermoanaerobaculia bacterium]
MGSPRFPGLLSLVVAFALLPSPAEAKLVRKKRQEKPKPSPIVVDAGADPDEVREAGIEARRRGTTVVSRALENVGPGPRRAPGARREEASGTGLRPRDVLVTDPSFDGFPANTHTEPSIAAQGASVVCVFNDGGADAASTHPATGFSNADGWSLSQDGGATFQDQGKRSPAGVYSFSGDNVVAAGPDGDFYYVSDGGVGANSYSAMPVSRSTDGGRTWGVPANAATGTTHRFPDGFFDKGWIAVDRSTLPTRGTVYVTWSDFSFSAGATDLYVSRSTDRGATWRAQKLDSFSHPVAVTYVQTASNGWVFVGEQDEGTFVDGALTGTNYTRVSTDGGATWSPLRSAGPYRSVGDAKAVAQCGDPGFFGGLVRYLNGPIEADSSLWLAV